MIEIIKDSYLGLNREELDGEYLCIPTKINKPIFFNSSLFEIFSVCNHKSIYDVQKYMLKKYPDISEKRIKSGVENALWYLRNIGIIRMEGESAMYELSENELFAMPEEWEFESISNFMETLLDQKECFWYMDSNISLNKKSVIRSMCEVEVLRYGHATGSRIIYQYSANRSKDIDGVVIFNLHSFRRVAYIQTLIGKDEKIAREILENLKKTLNENRVYNIKILFSGRKKEESLVKFFKRYGFVQEAVLKNEAYFGDLHVYTFKEEAL